MNLCNRKVQGRLWVGFDLGPGSFSAVLSALPSCVSFVLELPPSW